MTASDDIIIPGAPAPQPPTVAEPTDPAGPLPPKPDQAGPDPHTPTGAESADEPADLGGAGKQQLQHPDAETCEARGVAHQAGVT